MGLPIKLFSNKSKDRHLLVVELEPKGVRLAYFHDTEGELSFGGNSIGETPEAALQTLPVKPAKVTDLLVGIPFSGLIDDSTVVKYRRQEKDKKISEEEVRGALAQIPPLPGDGEVFFEDLFNAKIDGLPTFDPVDRLGEIVELNYYQATSGAEHLKSFREKVAWVGPQAGLVPTAYAVAKLVSQASPKGALTLDIDPDRTEISLTSQGHLVGIKSFDVGGNHKDLLIHAMEASIEELDWQELWPEQVYLCGTVSNYEEIRSELLAYPWTKKVNMMGFPEISVFHPLSVNLTLPSDVGLNALSLLG